MTGPLAGITVLVARPAGQAGKLVASIESAGGRTLHLPALVIEPLEDARAREALARWARYDAVVLVSANAARRAAQVLAALGLAPSGPAIVAVGEATAAAWSATGGPDAEVPALERSSAGVLALPRFAPGRIRGREVLIVRGVGGRPEPARGLAARGARVTVAELYRRVPAEPDPRTVARTIDAHPPQVLVAASGETLAALARMLRLADREQLLDLAVVVPARRLVAAARGAGFRGSVRVARSARDADMLQALCQWAQDEEPVHD